MRSWVYIYFNFILLSSLSFAGHPLEKGEITLAQLEAGFQALARNHGLEPSAYGRSEKAVSWLDGVVGLNLTQKIEDGVVQYLRGRERRREITPSGSIPQSKIRWSVARFYELRGRDDEALALFEGGGEVNDFEKLGLVRLRYRKGDMEGAVSLLETVSNWRTLRIEAEVVNQLGSLDDYQKFLMFLRENVSPEDYRRNVYPLELDLAFHQGRWKAALDESAQRGEMWRFLARTHYGEALLGEDFPLEMKEETALEKLLLFPAAFTYERLKEALIRGDLSTTERQKVVDTLLKVRTADWLVEWQHFQPRQFEEDLIWVAKRCQAVKNARGVFLEILDEELFASENYRDARVFADQEDPELPELLEFVRTYSCAEGSGLGRNGKVKEDLDGPHRYPILGSENQEGDELLFLLTSFRSVADKKNLEVALLRNLSFQKLRGIERLGYLFAGNFEESFTRELKEGEWTVDEAKTALHLFRYFYWNQAEDSLKKEALRECSTLVLGFISDDSAWEEWVERWALGMGNLRFSKAIKMEEGRSFFEEVARVRGMAFEAVVEAMAPRAVNRSTLQELVDSLRTRDRQLAAREAELAPGTGTRQRDLDYAVGLTLLTMSPKLPVMRVNLPNEKFSRGKELYLLLPRRLGYVSHRLAKAETFASLRRSLAADDWSDFQLALFKMARVPAEGEGSFVQEHHRKALTGEDYHRSEIFGMMRTLVSEEDREVRLAKAALDFSLGRDKEVFLKTVSDYPQRYRSDLARIYSIRGATSPQKEIHKTVKAVPNRWPECQKRGEKLERDLREWDQPEKRELSQNELITETVKWISENPREEMSLRLLSSLLMKLEAKKGGEEDLVKRLSERCFRSPGGRQALVSLFKKSFLKSNGSGRLSSLGRSYDRALRYLKTDPANEDLVRILTRETISEGRDLDLLWSVYDDYQKREGLDGLARAISFSRVKGRSPKRIPAEVWSEELLAYLYRQDCRSLHRLRSGYALPGFKFVRKSPEKIARYREWLMSGGKAGFAYWDRVPSEILDEMPEEALKWVKLALLDSGNEDLGEIGQGYDRETYGNFWQLVSTEHFENFCRQLAGKLRKDLSPRTEILILIGTNDPSFHERIVELVVNHFHPRVSYWEFGREMNKLRDLLRKSPEKRDLLMNLETALFSDPELRASSDSWLYVAGLPADQKDEALAELWETILEYADQFPVNSNPFGPVLGIAMRTSSPQILHEMLHPGEGWKMPAPMLKALRSQIVAGHNFVSDENLKVIAGALGWVLKEGVMAKGFSHSTEPSIVYRLHRLSGSSDENYLQLLKDHPKSDGEVSRGSELEWKKFSYGDFRSFKPGFELTRKGGKLFLDWSINGFLAPDQKVHCFFDGRVGVPGRKMELEIRVETAQGGRRVLKTVDLAKATGRLSFDRDQVVDFDEIIVKVIRKDKDEHWESKKLSVRGKEWKEIPVPTSEVTRLDSEKGPMGWRQVFHVPQMGNGTEGDGVLLGRAKIPDGGLSLRSWLFYNHNSLSRALIFFDANGEEIESRRWAKRLERGTAKSWTLSNLRIEAKDIPAGATEIEVRVAHRGGLFKFTSVEILGIELDD